MTRSDHAAIEVIAACLFGLCGHLRLNVNQRQISLATQYRLRTAADERPDEVISEMNDLRRRADTEMLRFAEDGWLFSADRVTVEMRMHDATQELIRAFTDRQDPPELVLAYVQLEATIADWLETQRLSDGFTSTNRMGITTTCRTD